MRFFKDKHSYEDGTTHMRFHYVGCKQGFLGGITPDVELYRSELIYEKIECYRTLH